MQTRNLLIPGYLVFLLMVARLVWTPVDGELASVTFVEQSGALLSGKIAVILIFGFLVPFLITIRRPIRTIGIMPCVLYGFAAISLAWTYDMGTTLYLILILTSIFGYTMAMNAMWGVERALAIIWIFASVVILASVALSASGDPHGLMGGNHVGAWRGLFIHKNSFGPFIVIHLFLTIFGRSYIRLPLLAALLIAAFDVALLPLTRSSTAILAAVAGLAAGMVFLPIRNSSLRLLWRMGIVAVFLAVLFVLVFNVDQIFALLGKDSGMTGRSLLWSQAYDLTFRHWLGTGYGTGGGSQVSINLQKAFRRHDTLGVQSGYLNLALELGWIAVALFVLWLVSAIVATFASRSASPAQPLFVSLAVAHLIGSYSESFGGIYPSWSLTVLVTALIANRATSSIRFRAARGRRAPVAVPA